MIDLSYDGTNKRVRALGTTTNTRTKRYTSEIELAPVMFFDYKLFAGSERLYYVTMRTNSTLLTGLLKNVW